MVVNNLYISVLRYVINIFAYKVLIFNKLQNVKIVNISKVINIFW